MFLAGHFNVCLVCSGDGVVPWSLLVYSKVLSHGVYHGGFPLYSILNLSLIPALPTLLVFSAYLGAFHLSFLVTILAHRLLAAASSFPSCLQRHYASCFLHAASHCRPPHPLIWPLLAMCSPYMPAFHIPT